LVLDLAAAPAAGTGRDRFARRLVGKTPVDGLGGGTPITNKVVLVGSSTDGETDVEYIVGNVAADASVVDWSGTCGNMTAAVVPFAAMAGMLPRKPDDARFTLRNLATRRTVNVSVDNPESLGSVGTEVRLTTEYVSPGGSVLGSTLPTGKPRQTIAVDDHEFDGTIIDVTHPYLLLRRDQILDGRVAIDDRAANQLERIRGEVCVMLGLCGDAASAREVSPAIPRLVLIHPEAAAGVDVRITAISMGHPIPTVPVTAAMSIAAACRLNGTVVGALPPTDSDRGVYIAGPSTKIRAWADVDETNSVRSTSVGRTARCLMRGTALL
jgi:2-methylaconitate cis-trans-isomerase PrpF